MRIALLILGGVLFCSGFGRAQGDTEHQQHYPNIPTEFTFENDRALVQNVVLQPGEWEGIHSHSGNQPYIILTAGETPLEWLWVNLK